MTATAIASNIKGNTYIHIFAMTETIAGTHGNFPTLIGWCSHN